jgi:NTE family protein
MLKKDVFDLVKATKIFSCLPDPAIEELVNRLETVEIPQGKLLFRQGDAPDGLFVVAKGKIVILVRGEDGVEKFVTDIHSGESMGEVGILTHEPRNVSAKGLEDSVLLKLSTEDFHQLCHQHSVVLHKTVELLSQRSKNLVKLFSARKLDRKHIVFCAANKDISMQKFMEKIRVHSAPLANIYIISDGDADFKQQHTSAASIKKHISEAAQDYSQIFYFLELHDSLLAQAAMDVVDMLYVVAHGEGKIYLNQETLKRMHARELLYKSKPDLIVLHENSKTIPKEISAWLKLAKFSLHHHIRLEQDKDWARIMRFFCGQAVGLVLGGGGVRGWAHVGAIKALTEAGVPIDIIGGTSGGSIVAGFYALHETYEDCHQELHKLSVIARQSIILRNITYPAVAWFSSKDYTAQIKKMFGRARIENLWVPFFCVTCNLSKSDQSMQVDGLLWKKIRASTAVPGIYPPVLMKGQMHLDGGIVNNLPVDLMRQWSPSIGTIIAVELIHNVKDDIKYQFPPVLTFWSTLLTKLRLIHRDYRFPGFIDMFLRALLVGSAVRQTENAKAADVLISPDLSDYSLLSIEPEQEHALIEVGYQATLKALRAWHHGKATRPRPKDADQKNSATPITQKEELNDS